MTTARDVISLSSKEAGILGVGQSLLSEDFNDIFLLFSNMLAEWQKSRWLVPSLFDIVMTGNNATSNKMGDGQYWNTPRPDKIQAGYTIQRNTGGNPVSLPLYPIFSYEDYARIAVKSLQTVPRWYFYDGAFPYGNLFIWPIPDSSWDIHMIIKSQLGFATTIEEGEITDGGAAYTDGNYVAVPLTGGNGISASADITVTAGVIAVVTLLNGGQGYQVSDVLSADAADVGGTGAGFEWTVNALTSNLDSVMELPPEYFSAMHYNLALRIISMYGFEDKPQTTRLARATLNTIRKANTQVPAMQMPPMLRHGKSFNIYNADGY